MLILNPDIKIPSSIPRNIKTIDAKVNGVSYGTLPMWACVPDTWYTNTMGHDVWLCLILIGRYGQNNDDPILTVLDKNGRQTGYYVGIGDGDQGFRCPLLEGGRYYFYSRNEITGGYYHPYNCVYSRVWYEW